MPKRHEASHESVQPIKFSKFSDNFDTAPVQASESSLVTMIGGHFAPGPVSTNAHSQAWATKQPTRPAAVVFENVLFSVKVAQQEAGFVAECLFSTKRALSNLFGLPSVQNQVDILKRVNLHVPHGCILGLLGPSSCGKTTLLRCLVGLLRPRSGSIHLFGSSSVDYDTKAPRLCADTAVSPQRDHRRCCVPGANIGYMPQDLGLYEDFTIRKQLQMFGKFMGLEQKLIESRIEFMREFLDLPEIDRVISTLSGGQKRRVSFATACLHMPPLIILDEPTVGVDPLLRKSIWRYLRRLASEQNKTIIITTHYIEEAAQADQVALMRAGEILVQDEPAKIMRANGVNTLEEAFLKICNGVESEKKASRLGSSSSNNYNNSEADNNGKALLKKQLKPKSHPSNDASGEAGHGAHANKAMQQVDGEQNSPSSLRNRPSVVRIDENNPKSRELDYEMKNLKARQSSSFGQASFDNNDNTDTRQCYKHETVAWCQRIHKSTLSAQPYGEYLAPRLSLAQQIRSSLRLLATVIYKNWARNTNSAPLVAFQFILPIIQMVSFSLCVGGKPTGIGLGLVNNDVPIRYTNSSLFLSHMTNSSNATLLPALMEGDEVVEPLSLKFLSFLDRTMLRIVLFDKLPDALESVKRGKLWAAIEIGENFTAAIERRFDLEKFYELDPATVMQSLIKIYPDRSNKVLDSLCLRSIIQSYQNFLLSHFEHFRELPIKIKQAVYDIKPNAVSNSVDGYTESIAPGLLASLTYIMAAGLTTFIMVVERGSGILERTYTSGISPVLYLTAHGLFRSFAMLLQIAVVLGLTFYVLQQPLVGSIWTTYFMLMTLNCAGISFGLLISSIVADQNAAALTIVGSLIVKITLSGILWPLEAVPNWLRPLAYVNPLAFTVHTLRDITLKGAKITDWTVQRGFIVAVAWMIVFLVVAAKNFKFYKY